MQKKIPTLFIQLANALAASIVIPILPLLAIEHFGATPFQAISLESSYYLTKLISTPYLASLSDRYGRKPIFLIGQCGTFFGLLLIVFLAPILNGSEPNHSFNLGLIVLFLARSLDGITGGNTTIAKIYLTEILPKEDHAKSLGQLAAMLGIGFIAGPALGGFLASRFGLVAPFAGAALLASIALLTIIFFIRQNKPAVSSNEGLSEKFSFDLHAIIHHPSYLKLAVVGFLGPLCFSAISPSLVLYVDQKFFNQPVDTFVALEISQFVGWMYTFVGISLIISQLTLIQPLSNWYGESRVMFISHAGLVLFFFLIPLMNDPVLFLVVLVFSVVFYGLLDPTLQVLIVQAADDNYLGRRMGLFSLLKSSANLLGPILAGWLFQSIAPSAIWWSAVIVLIPALIVSSRLVTQKSRATLSA